MFSSLPKVLIPVCGRPMLLHILDRVQEAQPQARIAVVVGHQKEKVIEAVQSQKYSMKIAFVFGDSARSKLATSSVSAHTTFQPNALNEWLNWLIEPP